MDNLCHCTFPDGGYGGLKHAEIKEKYQFHPLMQSYIVLCCNCCMEVQQGLVLRRGYILEYLAVKSNCRTTYLNGLN